MGAGKSTLVKSLAAVLGFTPRLERPDANPFFERFIEDPPRWALWSLLAFILDSVNQVSLACEDSGIVVERPPEEMLGVFARERYRRGLLSDADLHLLEQTFALSYGVAQAPDLLVFLHGDPRSLHERLRRRAAVGDHSFRLVDMEMWVSAYATWRATLSPDRVIDRNISERDLASPREIQTLALEITERLRSRRSSPN
jgi:deoxyadenosine/deoxycytidine kinase